MYLNILARILIGDFRITKFHILSLGGIRVNPAAEIICIILIFLLLHFFMLLLWLWCWIHSASVAKQRCSVLTNAALFWISAFIWIRVHKTTSCALHHHWRMADDGEETKYFIWFSKMLIELVMFSLKSGIEAKKIILVNWTFN